MELVKKTHLASSNKYFASTMGVDYFIYDLFPKKYVKCVDDDVQVDVLQTCKEVACLLQRAGFAVKRADTDLTCCTWFRRCDDGNRECFIQPDEDSGLPHYGKSGYRWMIYAKPRKHHQMLGKEDDGSLLSERLDAVLVNDNREEFLLIIHQNKSLFLLEGQNVLEKACRYCALKCAEALLKGEAPVNVRVNGRTSDKMFPIHHAAKTCHPSITELLLYYGARADVRADVHCACHPPFIHCAPMPSFRQRLPLYLTLYQMSKAIWRLLKCLHAVQRTRRIRLSHWMRYLASPLINILTFSCKSIAQLLFGFPHRLPASLIEMFGWLIYEELNRKNILLLEQILCVDNVC